MNDIIIIEAPTNLGLKEPAPGVEPGVRFLPAALEKLGFAKLIGASKRLNVNPPPYSMQFDEASKTRNADAIASYSKVLGKLISEVIDNDKIPLVIGGDCSVMIGAALALKQRGVFGLFHLDGHTDYMWPEFSQTGGVAGMGLALVAGKGHEKLTDINGLRPYFREEDIYCIGNREYDDAYVELSVKSNMRYVDLEGIRENGTPKIATEFLHMVAEKKLDGFWIHFDVDVLNDEIMPCVDSRSPDGLWYEELKEMLAPLLNSSYFTGMEITILDPTRDARGVYTSRFVKEMAGIIKS